MNRTPTAQQTLQRLPKKWAVAIVVALIIYALVQPFANSRWGWNLPSLNGGSSTEKPLAKSSANSTTSDEQDTKVAEQKSAAAKDAEKKDAEVIKSSDARSADEGTATKPGPSDSTASTPSSKSSATSRDSTAKPQDRNSTATKESARTEPSSAAGSSTEKKSAASKAEPPKSTASGGSNTADANLLYGLLKDVGREVYISPAGLRYTRGSEEGHRLKHIEKHLKDIPDRPGKHGVFDGDMAQVLRWIDDAFTRGKQGAKGVRKREEDGRTVYEVPFAKTIGYVGGRDGKRDNNPDAKRLRLVVEGDQVITAFPF